MKRDDDTYFFHYDGLGSVRQLTGEPAIICFIATAAFGTPLAEEIEVLRRFRDYLLKNNWGRSLVEFYYEHSPPLAAYISEREWAQALVRSSLQPLLWFEGRRGRGRGRRRRRRIRREVEIVEKYTYCAFGTLLLSQHNPATASNTPAQDDNPISKTGVGVLACLFFGMGILAVKNRRGAIIFLLSIFLITMPATSHAAIQADITENVYGFTGEQQFGEADGLIFLRARYYDPSIGRFISRDPILLPMIRRGHRSWMLPDIVMSLEMLHPYVYVHNNPVNYIDPTGKIALDWALISLLIGLGLGVRAAIRCGIALQALDAKIDEIYAKIDAMPECTVEESLSKEQARREAAARVPNLSEYRIAVERCGSWIMGWYTGGPIPIR